MKKVNSSEGVRGSQLSGEVFSYLQRRMDETSGKTVGWGFMNVWWYQPTLHTID